MAEFYHIGLIDKSDIPLVENNLNREEIERIVKAYVVKKGMIVKSKVIDCDSIKQIAIFRTQDKFVYENHTEQIFFGKPEPHIRTDLPQGWWRVEDDGENITREIIEKMEKQHKVSAYSSRLRKFKVLLEPTVLVPAIIIPTLAIIVGALVALYGGLNQSVIVVDAPTSIADTDSNPFVGTWNASKENKAYPLIVIEKDALNRVWLHLYQHCSELSCHLGKLPAKIDNGTLTTRSTIDDWSFALTSTIQNGRLFTQIETLHPAGYSGVLSVTDFYERIPQDITKD